MLSLGSNISATQVVESKYSASFDGIDDFIDTNQTFQSVFRGDYSISFWIKPDDGQSSENVFGADNDADDDQLNSDEIYFQLQGDGKPRFVVKSNADVGVWSTHNGGGFAFDNGAASSWTHFVVTMNLQSSGNSIGKIYVNGVDKTNEEAALTSQHANYTSNLNIVIGGKNTEGTVGGFYGGGLDEFAIFNTVLDSDAVTAIYNNGSPLNLKFDQGNYDNSSALQAYYRMGNGLFDDKANGIVHDQDNPGFGSELNDGTWTANGGWSINGDIASNDGNGSTFTNGVLEIGKTYEFTCQLSSYTSGNFSLFLGNANQSAHFSSTDLFTFTSVCKGDINARVSASSGAVGSLSISSLSIKELNGKPGITSGGVTFSSDTP